MALLLMDGFDVGDTNVKGIVGNSAIYGGATRFGTGRAIVTTAVDGNVALYNHTPSTNIFIGFAALGINGTNDFCVLRSSSGTISHLTLRRPDNNHIALYRGATLLATSVFTAPLNAWQYFEINATLASSGGICQVRINGSTIINFSGNTRASGTDTTFDQFVLYRGAGTTTAWDDLYICDDNGPAPYNTFLGEIRIYSLSPTGAGSSTQWTPDSGSNYARVNEVPYSAANYVQSGTSGQRDTYAMADLPASVGTVLAVQNNVIAKRTDASPVSVKPALKSGASVYYGSSTALIANDMALTDLRTADPNTSAAWTASGANALEGGFEVA